MGKELLETNKIKVWNVSIRMVLFDNIQLSIRTVPIDNRVNLSFSKMTYYLITIPSNLDKSKACSVLTISPVNLFWSTTIPEISSLEKSILFKLTLINEERIIEESFTENRESLQSSKLVFLTDDSVIEKSFKLELLKFA